MNWPLPLQRAACWLTADRCWNIALVAMTPLWVIVLIGWIGGAP